MKLAVVNVIKGSTGGWRYCELLMKGLLAVDPSLEITLFYDAEYVKASRIKDLQDAVERLSTLNICMSAEPIWELSPPEFRSGVKFGNTAFNSLWELLRKAKFLWKHRKTIARSKKQSKRDCFKDFDLVFYTWPYDIACPETETPLAFIPHDFIFSHFFGLHSANYYSQEFYRYHKQGLAEFMIKGHAVVGSHYIADELKKVFPKYNKEINVIYHSKFNNYPQPSHETMSGVLKKYGIMTPYILYANNWAHHKNMGQVLGALYDVKQSYPSIKMVVSGFGTSGIRALCRSPYYCDHVSEGEEWDVLGLGLIPEVDFNALMYGASMVINASLCEAGNGSGLEAWALGVPVVMSEIPPFKNQIDHLGVRAELFDPRNSHDISRAILAVLDKTEHTAENVRISEQAMADYSWEKVAALYLEAFRKIYGGTHG